LVHCCCIAVTLMLYFNEPASEIVALASRLVCVVALLLHVCCAFVTLLSHCCHTVVTLLLLFNEQESEIVALASRLVCTQLPVLSDTITITFERCHQYSPTLYRYFLTLLPLLSNTASEIVALASRLVSAMLHCCHSVVTVLLHYCYTVVSVGDGCAGELAGE
jgi:hypothetical protein